LYSTGVHYHGVKRGYSLLVLAAAGETIVKINGAFGAKPFVAGLADAIGVAIRVVKAAHVVSYAWCAAEE
jgi:hypothetical protein